MKRDHAVQLCTCCICGCTVHKELQQPSQKNCRRVVTRWTTAHRQLWHRGGAQSVCVTTVLQGPCYPGFKKCETSKLRTAKHGRTEAKVTVKQCHLRWRSNGIDRKDDAIDPSSSRLQRLGTLMSSHVRCQRRRLWWFPWPTATRTGYLGSWCCLDLATSCPSRTVPPSRRPSASPLSSTGWSHPSAPDTVSMCSVHHPKFGSACHFHAKTVRLRGASRSVILCAEDVARRLTQRGTEGLEDLDEHASLEGHVQRSPVHTLERWAQPNSSLFAMCPGFSCLTS